MEPSQAGRLTGRARYTPSIPTMQLHESLNIDASNVDTIGCSLSYLMAKSVGTFAIASN